MKEFIVNEYITLKLEGGKTNIYVNGECFTQLKLYWIKDPDETITNFNESQSYDDTIERFRKNFSPKKISEILSRSEKISPEKEYESHCITLKNWTNSDYNTDLLSTNIAIPLLEELTKIGNPLAKKMFKEEIAKRFRNGYLSFILYIIKKGYLYYISAPEERESIYYHNNPKLRDLIHNLLQKDYASKTQALSILISLLNLKDPSVKKVLSDQIIEAFITGDLEILDYFNKYYRYSNISDEEKKSLYYDNNKKIKDIIDRALQEIDTSLNLGIPMLLRLIPMGDQSARIKFKEIIKNWLFSKDNSAIDSLFKKFHNNIKILFDYKELKDLYNATHIPMQFKDYFNRYFEIHKEIYSITREIILSRKEILEKSYFSNNEIPNSDFFIVFFRSRHNRAPYSVQPIYNNAVKKIVINYSRNSKKKVLMRVEELKSKYEILYEFFTTKVFDNSVFVRIRELYFLDSHIFTNNEIKNIFVRIGNEVRLKIEDLNRKS